MVTNKDLTAKIEPFDSFWEGPEDLDSGYGKFCQFYKRNYLKYLPTDRNIRILNISCGGGYFVYMANKENYYDVLGIDSFPEKVEYAKKRELRCEVMEAFPFLEVNEEPFDVIFCEQELNHLTKEEMLMFLPLARKNLKPNGILITHALNGSNPIMGAEQLAQNFDHYNIITEYTYRQILNYCQFEDIQIIPLNLYVFYKNPFNYVAWAVTTFYHFLFRLNFILYGKKNKLFTKKIAAVCRAGENK